MARAIRPRRYVAIFGSGIFIVVCLYLYTMLEDSNLGGISEETYVNTVGLSFVAFSSYSRRHRLRYSLGYGGFIIPGFQFVLESTPATVQSRRNPNINVSSIVHTDRV
jgi:hypothetical protein